MKVVLQDGIKDCGVCSLLSVIRFYGGEVSKEYLRELTHTTREGVSLYYLADAAKKLGFEVKAVSGDFEDIEEDHLPCIAHLVIHKSYKHFVVIYQIHTGRNKVTLMDPARGKRTISFSEFRLLSSSAYLFLRPIQKLPVIKKKNVILKTIQGLFFTHKSLLIPIVVLTFSYFLFHILCTFHFKLILDFSIRYQNSNSLYWISLIMFTFYFFKNINLLCRNILLNKWISLLDYGITSLTYKQILLLPYLYYKNRTTGEVVSRFKDLNVIRTFFGNFFCTLSTDFLSAFIFLYFMSRYHFKMTCVVFLFSLFSFLFDVLMIPYKKKQIRLISEYQDRTNSYIIQGTNNVDTIKGFHLEKRLIDKFSLHYHLFLEKIYHYLRFIECGHFWKQFWDESLQILFYGMGAYSVIHEQLSLSGFLIFCSFFHYFRYCFQNILSLVEEYGSYRVSLDRVEELFLLSHDDFQNHFFYFSYHLNGEIEYRHLSYCVGSKTLFHNLDLVIPSGKKVLLCGESGSGKSTLMKMLLRYIDVEYGKISIDHIDINHYHLENIRSYITYVTNQEYLFTDTLKNNILLYREVEEEEFEKICKMCFIDEIVQKNLLYYDTLIEENGFHFSNGERQRMILARSILRDSSIYILDEALSGVDVSMERKILEGVFSYLKEKTVIVISHRLNHKEIFDRTLQLADGVLHEI